MGHHQSRCVMKSLVGMLRVCTRARACAHGVVNGVRVVEAMRDRGAQTSGIAVSSHWITLLLSEAILSRCLHSSFLSFFVVLCGNLPFSYVEKCINYTLINALFTSYVTTKTCCESKSNSRYLLQLPSYDSLRAAITLSSSNMWSARS